MESPVVEGLIIFLVFGYLLKIFGELTMQDMIDDATQLKLNFVDIAILSIFILEITLKTLAFGKYYILDPWNLVDAIVVVASLILSLLQLLLSTYFKLL